MSADGAQLGVTPERALASILGGQPPPEDKERLGWYELRAKVLAATSEVKTYDDCCFYTTKLILEYWAEDEERESIPSETIYDDVDWSTWDGSQVAPVKELGLYERMKNDGVPLSDLGLTGFQWGWSTNAARFIKGLPEKPNPAIIEI